MALCVEEMPQETSEIRTRPCPDCAVCGARGETLYVAQPDRLFGAIGVWNSKRCPNADCGLTWLDPMPLAEDIGKAYVNYYTHASGQTGENSSLLKRWRAKLDENYARRRFGYSGGAGLSGWLLYLMPLRRRNLEVGWRFLNWVPGGKVLDVGCGAGAWLAEMKRHGWTVEGVDFDPGAVKAARELGLDVHCGSVEDQNYPDASFDAVTLNHVIEHVPDPARTLRECARVLKPGGKLVVVTPNGASLAHQLFKQDWRGLETPRHLHIFSPGSMQKVLNLAGFSEVKVRTQIVLSLPYESILLRRGGDAPFPARNLSAKVGATLFNFLELTLIAINPAVADCVAAVAVKH